MSDTEAEAEAAEQGGAKEEEEGAYLQTLSHWLPSVHGCNLLHSVTTPDDGNGGTDTNDT